MANRQPRLSGADRRQQIVQVASEIFASQGFKGSTTREIAQKAQVNEAIIFRHFPSKEDLYWAVVEEQCRVGRSRTSGELQRRLDEQGGDLRQMLTALATEILQRDTKLTRLLFYSALENHKLSNRFYRTYVARYYEVLAKYLRRRMEKGELRKMDPMLASRGFLGMIGNHFLVQEILGGKRYQKFNPRQVAETLTDVWLNGVLTKRSERSRKMQGSNGKRSSE
jgi:AcrR family transcriptional regulator